MIARVTAQGTTQTFKQLNATAESRISLLNRQIASGYKFDNPSESPADTSLLLGNERRLARIEQFGRNAVSAQQWLASSDQALQSTNDSLTRARTLVVQGLNSGASALSPAASAAEIRQIRAELLATANTTMNGRSIFAGTATGSAYDDAGVYQGDSGAVSRSIDTYEVLTVNQTGPDVFGVSNPGDPMNGSIFEQLDAIATALETGDSATASRGLDVIDGAMARVHSALGAVGAMVNRVDAAQVRLGSESLATTDRISKTRDTDLTEAIVGLQAAQTGYDALLSTTARAMSRSLLDFMR
jgi:flagellar hook-associated protein 3 FlgL